MDCGKARLLLLDLLLDVAARENNQIHVVDREYLFRNKIIFIFVFCICLYIIVNSFILL